MEPRIPAGPATLALNYSPFTRATGFLLVTARRQYFAVANFPPIRYHVCLIHFNNSFFRKLDNYTRKISLLRMLLSKLLPISCFHYPGHEPEHRVVCFSRYIIFRELLTILLQLASRLEPSLVVRTPICLHSLVFSFIPWMASGDLYTCIIRFFPN